MKKLLLLSLLSLITIYPTYGYSKNDNNTSKENRVQPQITVTGPDMMTVIPNGDTSPDFIKGTLFFDTLTGEETPSFFNISNLGFTDLNISSITITGTDASDFIIDGTPPTIVSPGPPQMIQIAFKPQTAGLKNATITINSDDPTTPIYSFAIHGNALEGGTGLHFDGVNDYIAFNNGNYSLTPDFSIELWIKPEISGTADHFILDTRDGVTGHGFFIDTMGYLNFTFYTSSGIQTLTSSSTLSNQWQHIALTYNGMIYKLFINGSLDASLSLTEGLIDSTNNLKLGEVAQGGGLNYQGEMDELRVWESALAFCGMENRRLCELAGDEINLVAYYNFNNGEVNGNNFPIYDILRVNHNITGGMQPEGVLMNFGLTGTTSNWIDAASNMVSGNCITYSEVSVSGAGLTIIDGDTSPSAIDATDFGDHDINGTMADNTYTVSNIGTGDLTISNVTITGANASDFTILNSPVGVVSSGSSGSLTIGFVPGSVGVKTATITIVNDDCDGSYIFDIQGTAILLSTGLNFDGTDDHIVVAHDSAFNINAFTIEAYFKTSTTSGVQPIISKYDTVNDDGFSMYIRDTGSIGFQYQVSNIFTVSQSSTSGLNDGNWHHIALVFGNGKLDYYIDGVLDNEIGFTNVPDAQTNTESLLIGRSVFDDTYFNGDLDEVRFWSRMLCVDEINAQRTCELTNGVSGLVAKYSLNQGVVGSDNTSETIASDSSTNNFTGTLTNFTLTGSASNWIDTTANGISGTCNVAIPEINIQGDGNDILLGDTTPETNDNTDAGTVVVGQTQDMNFFVRNTDGSANLLIDGIFLSGDTSEFTITQNPSGNPILATESAAFTVRFNPTSGGLKTVVVTIDSNDCDESFYTFAIQGYGAGPATGLDFDGTDDNITVVHNASQNNLDFSVDFWIKTTDGIGGVINKFTPDGNNGWRINLDGGRIEFYYYASVTNYTTRLLSGATYVADGNWHHVAITLDSGSARCYIDGVSTHSTGWNGIATAASSSADIQIGYAATDTPTGDTGGYFDGQLDELRVWTKTLTAFEVGALNSCSADAGQTDLLLSYNFNQGISGQDNSSEATLNDSSGNNADGTLTNFTLDGMTSNWIDTSANGVSDSCGCVVAGGVTLTTQTEVDNYVNNTLGTCNIIEGDLIIKGTITDVSGFSNIHTISGDLYFEGNIVDDLSGFTNLATIGGDLTFMDMTNTTSLSAFSNVTSFDGNFEVNNLDQLSEISMLNQLTSVSRIIITNNSILTNINFNLLQTINGNFTITFNGTLSTLSIPQLTQISNEFRINNNGSAMTSLTLPLLESVGDFRVADMGGITSINAPELETISSNASIGSCNALTTIALSQLISIGRDLSLDSCPLLDTITLTAFTTIGYDIDLDDIAIADLAFLQNVTSIDGLSFRDIETLNDLQGVDNLSSLGSFSLTNCDNITSLEGFPNLNITSLKGLNLSSNGGITTLSNSFLDTLTTLEYFNIVFNEALLEVDALQNVASLTDINSVNSLIRDNNALQSINLYALQSVTNALEIRDQASITSLCGLYNYVTLGDGATTLSFQGTNPTYWDSVQDILDNCNAGVAAKVFLQGASLNPNTGEESLMRDDLRVADLIPTTSPFSDGLTCSSKVFDVTGDNAIVDWIWLELRDNSNNTTVVSSRSALLQRDGNIVHTDGVSPVYFIGAGASNYYLVVKHRNHLGIMTANTVALSNMSATIDFTDANNPITYGTDAQTTFGMPTDVVGMWAGDATTDGLLNYLGASSDIPSIRSQVFNDPNNSVFGGPPVGTYQSVGYTNTDVDMNGVTVYSGAATDVLYIRNNIFNNPSNSVFGGPPVGTYIFMEQLP